MSRSRPNASPWNAANLALFIGTLAAIALSTVRMWIEARRGVFSSDECFHAYASEWVLAHHRLPTVLPEFYSGFSYYYQPLLHVIGALWSAWFGIAALHVLPVALASACSLVLLLAPFRGVPRAARCWAVLLCALNESLANSGVQLYVESLTSLLFVLALFALLEVDREPRARWALALGGAIGLALLAKFSGWLLFAYVVVSAFVAALGRDRAHARAFALSALIALAIALPWLIRNQVLFGSAFYPAFAPDLDRALYALNRQKFSLPAGRFLAEVPGVLGVWLCVAALAAVARALIERRFTIRERVLLFSLLSVLAMAWTPMAAGRHVNALIPVLALVSAWSLADLLESKRALSHAVSAVLVVAAIATWAGARDDRSDADPPMDLRQALSAIRPLVPPGDTILSLWTYDTFYTTRRNATWPIPWGQRVHPDSLFFETDPARFLAQLDRFGIQDLLVPRGAGEPRFDSANYPASFMRCVGQLTRDGALRLEWQSGSLELLRRTPRVP
jgi:hypothetical protein